MTRLAKNEIQTVILDLICLVCSKASQKHFNQEYRWGTMAEDVIVTGGNKIMVGFIVAQANPDL